MAIDKNKNPDFFNEYLRYLRIIKGNSVRTVNGYFEDIRIFLRYLLIEKANLYKDIPFEEIPIKDFDFEIIKTIRLNDIYDYMYFISEERHNNSLSRARKLSSLNSFFNYLHKKANLIEINPMTDAEIPLSAKKGRVLPKFLTLDESMQLLESIRGSFTSRDYCIITLFLNCGMRLSELVALNIPDINYTERTMLLHGKGNKERNIYLNDACISALEAYMKERLKSDTDVNALFISKQKKRISKRRVQQIVEENLQNAGLNGKGLSTHKLRHTAATLMYQYGDVDTLMLKDILGHENISTTEIYTHVSDNQMKTAMQSSPLADIRKKNNS